jgi:hypothetical protein
MPICTPFVDNSAGRITVCTAATRPTGGALYDGKWIYESDTDRTLFYDSTTPGWVIHSEPLQAYTPTWVNLTASDSSQIFYYRRSDGWCDIQGRIVLTATASVGTAPTMSVPIAADTASWSHGQIQGRAVDVAPITYYPIQLLWATSTTVALRYVNAAAATSATLDALSATLPHAWTTSDYIEIWGRYPMATRIS